MSLHSKPQKKDSRTFSGPFPPPLAYCPGGINAGLHFHMYGRLKNIGHPACQIRNKREIGQGWGGGDVNSEPRHFLTIHGGTITVKGEKAGWGYSP